MSENVIAGDFESEEVVEQHKIISDEDSNNIDMDALFPGNVNGTEVVGRENAEGNSKELMMLRETVTRLNSKCQELLREKADLSEELEQTKRSLQAESEALANKTDDSKELETLQLHAKKLEQEIASISFERDALENNLEELDEQHEQAILQIIQTRDSLSAQVKDLLVENESLKNVKTSGDFNQADLEEFWEVIGEAGKLISHELSENKGESGMKIITKLVEDLHELKFSKLNLEDKLNHLTAVENDYEKLRVDNLEILNKNANLESKLATGSKDSIAKRGVLQEQVIEMRSMISSLETQVRERDQQANGLKDILKVYKENLDPDLEAAKSRELELQQKLDSQQRNEETEKARMMSVLNDKVRENSSLKSEVHRLVNVVSAERAALSKLQKDCEQLAASQKDGDSQINKQTVMNLSRMVSDRTLEVEALKEKNQTLTTLLQTGTSDSSAVTGILAELEEARRKITQYQSEHEQLVTLVNQKHQESLGYHSELVKLSAVFQEERTRNQTINEQHEDLLKKLEEKQNAYLVTHNESVALQSKLAEVEQQHENLQVRYNRLLQEDQLAESSNQDEKQPESSTLRVDREEWNFKTEELEKCRQQLQDKDRMLYEKDCLVHEKMRHIESSRELFKRKEEELSSANQRYTHLSGQLETSHSEARAAREQNASLRSKLEDYRSEIALLKETNSALSVTLQEREFELKALRGKVETLSRFVEQQRSAITHASQEEEEKNNIRKLLSDSEEMRQRAQGFQAERDQTMLALSHKQRENEYVQDQLRQMKEREERLVRELDRLRNHLVHVEDSYTQEAVRSEDREKELRTRLSQAEDRIRSATSNHSMASQHASLQVESLQEQLKSVMEQRDSILEKSSNLEDQLAQKTAALRTLQVVLEQLQEEKRRDIAAYQVQFESTIRMQKDECLRLSNDVDSLAIQLQEANEALAAASRLTEQLDRKEETILMLKEHVEFQETSLEKARSQLEQIRSNSDVTVDKTIIRNLVVGYLTLSTSQKKEILRIIATVLDFNKEEREKTGLEDIRVGWISWLSGKPSSPIKTRQISQQSLTEAFVRFLENESQPKPNIRLSIESLTSSRESRLKRSTNSPSNNESANSGHSFNANQLQNPFVVSLMPSIADHQTLPLVQSGSDTHSNLLMKPMSTALPTFLPLVDKSATNDILRDVLK